MNLLSSALPGLREVRAPLIAGYVWLLLAYLIVEPGADFENLHGTAADLVDLAHAIGPIATAAAVSVAAFFLGALSQSVALTLADWARIPLAWLAERTSMRLPLARQRASAEARSLAAERATIEAIASDVAGDRRDEIDATERIGGFTHAATAAQRLRGTRAEREREQSPYAAEIWRLEQLDLQLVRNVWQITVFGTRRLEEDIARAEGLYRGAEGHERGGRVWGDLVRETRWLAVQAEEQLEIPATLLVGDEALPFGEADRERAEAELRIGASLPLAALAVVIGGWWLLLLLPALALMFQGLLRQDWSRRVVVETIVHKDIPFTPFDRFKGAVDAAEAEVGIVRGP